MHQPYDYHALKEIQQRILEGIRLQDTLPLSEIKTLAAFDLTFRDKKAICVAIVLAYPSFDILEEQHTITDEIMPYNPRLLAFREGPPIIETFKLLQHQPDLVIVDGNGALHPHNVGIASYIGVMLNKPSIGVAKDLIHGHLDEDKIMIQDEHRGTALKTKEYARPIYVSPGHGISLASAVVIVKTTLKDYKLPYPLHLAHKQLVKLKKELGGKEEQ